MWNLEVLKNKIKVLNRGKNFFLFCFCLFFLNKQLCTMKAHYEKKKVNSIVIKETTIFKKSSSKQLWNLKNVAVTFTDRSELSDQQHRDFLSLPRGTCRTMRAQNRAGRGSTGQGREWGEGGKKKNRKSWCTKWRESFFFSFWNIGRKQKTREATCKIYSLQTPHWQNKCLVPVSHV